VCVCVLILCIAARLHGDIAFREPSLGPVELSQPPVLPLLQHADDVALGEAQHRGGDVAGAGGEVERRLRGGRPRGDGSSQQRGGGLRGGGKRVEQFFYEVKEDGITSRITSQFLTNIELFSCYPEKR